MENARANLEEEQVEGTLRCGAERPARGFRAREYTFTVQEAAAEPHFQITHAKLDDYRDSHASPKRSMFHRKSTEEY